MARMVRGTDVWGGLTVEHILAHDEVIYDLRERHHFN